MEKIYLSDSISDADSFSITELNLIVAPAGSGKTYFALTKLPDLLKIEHKERILYLIDTCAGRDQICYLNKDNAVFYDTLFFIAIHPFTLRFRSVHYSILSLFHIYPNNF